MIALQVAAMLVVVFITVAALSAISHSGKQ